MMPTSLSSAITTNDPMPLSAIRLMAWKTDSSGPTDQTWWPLYRRIEATVSYIYVHLRFFSFSFGASRPGFRFGSQLRETAHSWQLIPVLNELGIHRNRGVEQLG